MRQRRFSEGLSSEKLVELLRQIKQSRQKVVAIEALIELLEAIEEGAEEAVPFSKAFHLVEQYMRVARLTYQGTLQFRISREDGMMVKVPRLLLVDTLDQMLRILSASVPSVELFFHLYADDQGRHLSAKIHFGQSHLDEPMKDALSAVFEDFHHHLPKKFSRSLMIREDGLRLCLTEHENHQAELQGDEKHGIIKTDDQTE